MSSCICFDCGWDDHQKLLLFEQKWVWNLCAQFDAWKLSGRVEGSDSTLCQGKCSANVAWKRWQQIDRKQHKNDSENKNETCELGLVADDNFGWNRQLANEGSIGAIRLPANILLGPSDESVFKLCNLTSLWKFWAPKARNHDPEDANDTEYESKCQRDKFQAYSEIYKTIWYSVKR